ncbi:hypothetical protein HMPREF1486_01897 [Streptomyces sp. HPH0547]|nr:hypothetical protein HMPREF1486_01897 [Streptomyces sp. HPH0547]
MGGDGNEVNGYDVYENETVAAPDPEPEQEDGNDE